MENAFFGDIILVPNSSNSKDITPYNMKIKVSTWYTTDAGAPCRAVADDAKINIMQILMLVLMLMPKLSLMMMTKPRCYFWCRCCCC